MLVLPKATQLERQWEPTEAQQGKVKAASIWLWGGGEGEGGGRKNSWRGENKQGERREELAALTYVRKHSVYQNSGPKKSRSCQNNEYRHGAFYSRRCRTVLFTVPLISAGTVRRLPISKGQDCVFFPSVDVYSRLGDFFISFFFSSAKQNLIQSQDSCNVHTLGSGGSAGGGGGGRRAAIEYVNSSRLILLCESPGKMSSNI